MLRPLLRVSGHRCQQYMVRSVGFPAGLELSFRVGVRGVFGVKNNTRVPRDRVGPWSRGVGDGPSPTEKN